jgi:hypothetical protein
VLPDLARPTQCRASPGFKRQGGELQDKIKAQELTLQRLERKTPLNAPKVTIKDLPESERLRPTQDLEEAGCRSAISVRRFRRCAALPDGGRIRWQAWPRP